MASDLNDAQTDPDVTPQPLGYPNIGTTIPYNPGAPRQAGAQPGQPPYIPTIPYPGPLAPPAGWGPPAAPTVPDPQAHFPAPAQQRWPGYPGFADPNAITVMTPAPARIPAAMPAPRPVPRTRPVASAPAMRTPPASAPALRVWRLLPVPHALLGVGLVLLMAALNIPWGVTSGGTLVYAQSFPIPGLSDQPDAAAQLVQDVVSSAALLSLALAGLNYFLTFLNFLARPFRMAGCATALLMPVMLSLMALLLIVDIGALVFGAFDPLAGVALMPWQAGFSLNGAHAELGYYAWYVGVILNAAGMLTQPFVRR